MARSSEEILEDLLRETRGGNEAAAESNRISFRLVDEVSKAIGVKGNIQQPFAFVGMFSKVVDAQVQIISQFQKSAVGFGATVNLLRQSSVVDKTRSQFGSTIAFTTAINALSEGTFGLSDRTFTLGAQMEAAGQSSKALFQVQRNLLSLGGLTISQMDNLTTQLINARDSYGISTEYLVDSISLLSDKFADFNLLGITADVTTLMTQLTAKYGAGNDKLFANLIKAITTGDRTTEFARAGLAQEYIALQQNLTVAGLEDLASKMSQYQSTVLAQQQAPGLAPSRALEKTKQITGADIALFKQFENLQPSERLTDPAKIEEAIRLQKPIQEQIAQESFKMSTRIADLVTKADSSLFVARDILTYTISLLTTSVATIVSIERQTTRLLSAILKTGYTPDRWDKLLLGARTAAASPILAATGRIAGGLTAIGAGLYGLHELGVIGNQVGEKQVDTLTLILSAFGVLTGISSALQIALPFMGAIGAFLFSNPIGLALVGVAAAIGITNAFLKEEQKQTGKPIQAQIVNPKTGGEFNTSQLLFANTELTKAIISNVLNAKQREEVLIDIGKKQIDLAKDANDINAKLLRQNIFKQNFTPVFGSN
jgi:hypothetical protein